MILVRAVAAVRAEVVVMARVVAIRLTGHVRSTLKTIRRFYIVPDRLKKVLYYAAPAPSRCGNDNWARRLKCNKCGVDRPRDAAG